MGERAKGKQWKKTIKATVIIIHDSHCQCVRQTKQSMIKLKGTQTGLKWSGVQFL